MNKKSLFEHVNSFTLSLIALINNKLLRLDNLNSKLKFILCYHSVGNSGWRFATPVKDFEEQINYLLGNYQIKSLPNLLSEKSGGVAITFDDGYEDVYGNAFPILKRNKIPAAIFILGDQDNANRHELENDLKFMDLSEIKHLKNEGWEIGSHTNTHADLYKLSNVELNNEIEGSKKRLESKLGSVISYFAYPKGKYDYTIMKIVKNAGYTSAFTVDSGFLNTKNKMKITRLPMEGVVGINQFSAMLSYIGLITESLFMEILKIKEKLTGNQFKYEK